MTHDHDRGEGGREGHPHGGDRHRGGHDGDAPHADDCHHHADAEEIAFGVLTVSTSRTLDEDESGDAIVELLEDAGHAVARRDLVSDDARAIRAWIEEAVADPTVDAAITTGGTGLSPDDVTVLTVEPLFDREVAGFGERFRSRSAESVGPRAMLSDATAGIVDGVPVFCLPGSVDAVTLGVSELVLPTVGHVVGLQRADGSRPTGDDDGGGVDAETPEGDALTHVDESGQAGMVDVGEKPATKRRAVARGTLHLRPETVAAIRADEVAKGDVLATARIGAIDAVKHTWETIPLCHQIPITNVDVEFDLGEDRVTIEVAVETVGQTGCEMEALQGVTTGLGVAWDMVKSAEKDEDGQYPETHIADVRVVEKTKTPLDENL